MFKKYSKDLSLNLKISLTITKNKTGMKMTCHSRAAKQAKNTAMATLKDISVNVLAKNGLLIQPSIYVKKTHGW